MTLLLVDSMGLLYRGHFAMSRNPLLAPDGTATSGLTHLLAEIYASIDKYGPTHMAIAFDSAAPGFRKAILDTYKANRPPMPDDLAAQAVIAPVLVEALGFPVLKSDGFEADDLIASATALAGQAGCEVLILSADKDLLQLVGPGVKVLQPGKPERPGRPAKPPSAVGPAEVPGILDVRADQVADFLSLAGDASDNIPGIRGIGPKTAARLLGRYGSIEGIYSSLEDIGPLSLRRRLEGGRAEAELSRRLVELRRDALPGFRLEDLVPRPPDMGAAVPMLERLALRRILEKLRIRRDTVEPPAAECREPRPGLPVTIDPAPGVVALVPYGDPECICDPPAGFALAIPGGGTLPVSPDAAGIEVLSKLSRVAGLVSTDLKRCLHALSACGIEWAGLEGDTGIAGYLLGAGTRAADGDTPPAAGRAAGLLPPDPDGSCSLAASALASETQMRVLLDADPGLGSVYRSLELPLVPVLASMERRGVALDGEALSEVREQFASELAVISERAAGHAGGAVNLNSPARVSAVLFDVLGLPRVRKTGTGGDSSGMTVLQALSGMHPFVEDVIEHRELAKLLSTYVDRLPDYVSRRTGLIHTSFNQTVTATGRLSSSDPNLQNIPIRTERGRQVRKCFRPGGAGEVFVSADYSQIELRVLAHFAGEGSLRRAYEEDADIHARTALAVFGDSSPDHRRKAKEVNFSIVYGISPHGLAQRLGIRRDEAAGVINRYFETYPEVDGFFRRCVYEAEASGETRTISGRRRLFHDLRGSRGTARKALERMVVNTTIQGSAADIMKVAMIKVFERLRREMPDAGLVLQVHDELVVAVRDGIAAEAAALVKAAMESAVELAVPLKAGTGTGRDWLEAGH